MKPDTDACIALLQRLITKTANSIIWKGIMKNANRRSDVRSRDDIVRSIEQRGADLEEKIGDLDKIEKDVQTVRDTLANLELGGTAEGNDAVEEAITDAESTTVEVFDREDENLEQLQSENEGQEQELSDHSDTTQEDVERLSEASSRMENGGGDQRIGQGQGGSAAGHRFSRRADKASQGSPGREREEPAGLPVTRCIEPEGKNMKNNQLTSNETSGEVYEARPESYGRTKLFDLVRQVSDELKPPGRGTRRSTGR